MFALYKNILDDEDTIITASNSSATMPLSNLLDDKLIKYARIADGAQYIQVSGGSKTVDAMAVAGWGFSSVVFQASNTTDFSTLLCNVTLSDLHTQSDTKCGFLHVWLSAPITAKYFRVVFSGENKKSIGKISIGTMKRFPWMDSKQKLSQVSTYKRTRSAGGHLFAGNVGYNARTVEMSFPEYNDAGFALFADLWGTCKNTKPFFSVIWDEKQDVSPLLYGALDQDSLDQEATGNPLLPFSTKIKQTECF